jgi:integrase
MRLFILMGMQMGLRLSEILITGPEHYNVEAHLITIPTKGHQTTTFRVPSEVAELFAIAPEATGGFVQRLRGRHAAHQFTIYKDWRKLLVKAGVKNDLTPHDLRRTAAVKIYRKTLDIFAAKALLGHKDITTTAHYLKAHETSLQPLDVNFWTPPKGAPTQ